ncbi:hypothetical protein V7S43_004392 [Phytophthora oleae]|uniref:Peptidase S1 domain-containing protein n=1 Tax=Phytophthora oleae TaxID=2107226 RepID=A0ABD3FWM5_9STRA
MIDVPMTTTRKIVVLRPSYGASNYCQQDSSKKQDYDTVAASVKTGVTENTCSGDTCPASADVNGDFGLVDDTKTSHWGINSNGTCYPLLNSYLGAYLRNPDDTDDNCESPRNSNRVGHGDVRRMLDGNPIFEVMTDAS